MAVCGRNAPEPGVLPDDVLFVAADVRDPESVAGLVDAVVGELGGLHLAVNNAGGSPGTDAATASPRFSDKILSLNLTAALHVSQAANAVMQAQSEGGSIINIGSLSGIRPTPGTAVDGAAKAGLLSLTTTLAMEWAPTVRVNMVTAGMVRTEIFEEYYGGPEGAAAVSATVPLGRVAEPEDVGNAVAWLASPLAVVRQRRQPRPPRRRRAPRLLRAPAWLTRTGHIRLGSDGQTQGGSGQVVPRAEQRPSGRPVRRGGTASRLP